MDRKTVIWISVGAGGAVLLLLAWLGIWVWMGTDRAQAAAGEFAALLQAGDLDALEMRCYAYSVEESDLLRDEEGQVQVQTVTRQQMALKFGEELVGDTSEEEPAEDGAQDRESAGTLEEAILSYDRVVSYSTGLVWGDRAVMTLTMEGPDIDGWMQGLTDEELVELLASGEALGEKLERKLAAGEVPVRTLRMQIPMVKQNGRWRFRVTQEMEDAFLGAPYPGNSVSGAG